jgi:acetolactate synthase-1/2/3 large subunit
LPIKFFVLCNSGYGSIRATQINYFERRFVACDEASGLHLPDLLKMADASGIPACRIDSQINLSAEVAAVLKAPGPVICAVAMAPEQYTQPRVSSKQLPDGSMHSMPMEDLWPFLDRSEFASVMAE